MSIVFAARIAARQPAIHGSGRRADTLSNDAKDSRPRPP
jgi:hypothetical protein